MVLRSCALDLGINDRLGQGRNGDVEPSRRWGDGNQRRVNVQLQSMRRTLEQSEGRPCGSTCVLPCQRMRRERTDSTATGNLEVGPRLDSLTLTHICRHSSVRRRKILTWKKEQPCRSETFCRYRQSARANRLSSAFICPPSTQGLSFRRRLDEWSSHNHARIYLSFAVGSANAAVTVSSSNPWSVMTSLAPGSLRMRPKSSAARCSTLKCTGKADRLSARSSGNQNPEVVSLAEGYDRQHTRASAWTPEG